MTTQSGKVRWSIKKEDVSSGSFEGATFKLGDLQFSMSSGGDSLPSGGDSPPSAGYRDRHRHVSRQSDVIVNPDQYGALSLKISQSLSPSGVGKSSAYGTQLGKCYAYGTLTLSGVSGKLTDTKTWDWKDTILTFELNNSLLTFDEIYLFTDGTYRFMFDVTVKNFCVNFSSPNHELILADPGCLLIENRRIYVSKSYLAHVSPYFKTLFYADFKEKNEDVITLQGVTLDAFMQFLAHLYERFTDERNAGVLREVMQLADMFLCQDVMQTCERILISMKSYTVADLKLADKYNLPSLRHEVIEKMSTADLKTYLGTILDDASSMYTRLRITDRLQKEGSRGGVRYDYSY